MRRPHNGSTTPVHCAHRLLSVLLTVFLLLGLSASAHVCGQTPANQLPQFQTGTDLPPDIVLNAGQGLGQCHWLDSDILAVPYVSWGYDASPAVSGWSSIEPQEGVYNWAALDAEIAKARNLGKHVWIELLTTEGLTPQWARDAGVVLVGSRGGTPVPWNETYQRLLRKAVHAMAARYDEDPTVDAVNLMAGGCYGEMSICAANTDAPAWEQAGYTDAKFVETVKQIIDIYLEDEHQWEDGSRSHGFRKKPVVLQLGSGLYGHTAAVIQPVLDYAMSTYGMRVWLKYNGFGGGYDMGAFFRQYDTVTRVGYEPMGNSQDFLNRPKQYAQLALEQHSSYVCLQSVYFAVADRQWQEARELLARHLGAQIAILSAVAPTAVKAGEQLLLTTIWANRGTVPLMRPERQGVKDVPASYDIQLTFVDAAGGSPVFEYIFTPSVPTTHWYSAQPITIEQTVSLPVSVPSGEYELRIALVNPSLSAQDEQYSFRLINTSLHDGSGRYRVGRIMVSGETAPTVTPALTPIPGPTPSPTPTPSPGGKGNWLSRLLRLIKEWLRNLLKAFR